MAGWRVGKRDGGCLIDVASGEVLVRGLSMPHSPRLQAGTLWLLNSGHGRLERYDPSARRTLPVAELPGYTRGLDLHGDLAFVGLSRIRETAIFGGLPLDDRRDSLRCGAAAVELRSGRIVATLFFTTGVEEIFDVRVLPGYRNPVLSGPYPDTDETETIWLVSGSPPPLPGWQDSVPGGDVRPRPATTPGQPAAATERPARPTAWARPRVVIHARPEIDWHGRFASVAAEGLRACGVPGVVTDERIPWYPRTHERFVRKPEETGWGGVIERLRERVFQRFQAGSPSIRRQPVWSRHATPRSGLLSMDRRRERCGASRRAQGVDGQPWQLRAVAGASADRPHSRLHGEHRLPAAWR